MKREMHLHFYPSPRYRYYSVCVCHV